MADKDEFWLEENYITNVDEILEICEANKDKFLSRGVGARNEFKGNRYGPSKLFTLFDKDMPPELKEAINKTIKDPEHHELLPDHYVINRYDPGSFLATHKDSAGKFWKFKLVFLRSDKPHLKIYNEKYPDGKLIEEKPGALFHIPLSLEHEVTQIGEDERPKYSLVMGWL